VFLRRARVQRLVRGDLGKDELELEDGIFNAPDPDEFARLALLDLNKVQVICREFGRGYDRKLTMFCNAGSLKNQEVEHPSAVIQPNSDS
jgi:hypothetical protein